MAEELTKIGNLPTSTSGQGIQESIRRLEMQVREIAREHRETAREQREMLSRIQGMLENSFRENRAARLNALSCSENSTVTRSDVALKPLYSYTTGQVIAHFPRNVAAIDRLSGTLLDRYLGELGLETDGTEEERKRRLKLACGVTKMAV